VLQALDTLSLYLLWRAFPEAREGRLPRVPRGPGDEGVELALTPEGARDVRCAPFPFAGDELRVHVAARTVPDRQYADLADLGAALDESPWTVEEHILHRG
jgi:hypothetical protein